MHAYEKIAQELATEINNGVWPPNTALPTIPELEARFGVSRITVRGGLEELARRGLVYTGYIEGRRGTIVRSRGRIDHYATDAFRSDRSRSATDAFTANAERIGKTPGKRFEMRIGPAPAWVAERLGVAEDELVVIRTVYQLLDGEPWSKEVGYYPRDLAADAGIDTPQDLPKGTIRALRDAGYAETAIVDEMTYDTASPENAKDLEIGVGAALAVQIRTAATDERVTRVMQFVRMAERQRVLWELGSAEGLQVIAATRGQDSR